MSRTRDRVIAIGAVVIIAALAITVVALVVEAQQRGIETREDLRLEQIESEADRMDALVQTSFASQATTFGAPGAFTLVPADPTDAAKLAPTNPAARTGRILVDEDGTIVNGSLLRDPDAIGTPLDREGLDVVLDGDLAVLPAGDGVTTTFPSILIGVPARDEAGDVVGAMLSETEIAADSPFNLFISEFSSGDTIVISYVDENDVVLASSDHSALGERLGAEAAEGLVPGFHRAGGQVAAIASVSSADWSLVFLQDIGEFQGDLTGPLQTALLLFLAAVGIGGVLTVIGLLRRLQAAREEERRLREIGDAREEFTSIVSHELRTPVAGLLGFLQTTIDHWDAMSDPERRRAVGRAFTNARTLQTLTSDVLDSASIEARTLTYRFESTDVRSMVQETVDSIRDATPGRAIEIKAPTTPVVVRADALRVRQVLGNLLDNAVKSSAPDTPINIDVVVGGGFATIAVRDRGPGIADEERERIFEKFTRSRAGISRGTGLGLYISRHIIEAHGGEIRAESVEGEPGARLSFTLRLAAASSASA